ncbi:MAG: hypothetical protein K9L64_04230 [Candidatus Izimaplasma sp.]|nr:hypothetical protein [Candidatus Izimaplasma bacterium]
MKKILIIIFIGLLVGCQTHEKEYKVIVPNGTPSIAQSHIEYNQNELNYSIDRVSGPQSLVAAFTSGNYDFIIAPINLGANLYQKQSPYQLAAIITWGNLQFISNTQIDDLSDLEGETIIAFGEGTINQMILETVINSYDYIDPPIIDYSASSTQESMMMFLQEENQIAVLAEPTTSIAKTMTESIYSLDISTLWKGIVGQSSFPQAGVFVNNNLTTQEITTYLEYLEISINFALENPEITGINCQEMNYPFSDDIITNSIHQIHYEYKLISEVKPTITTFMEMIYNFNPELIGDFLPNDEFYWSAQ